MAARFYADMPLVPGESIYLPAQTARHVQVLRMQPGGAITLFNGHGNGDAGSEGEFEAVIDEMGRSDVRATIGAYTPTARELAHTVHLAISMPANERMDWLVEKATELGVGSIQPLMSERSVLRLKGERADKKVAHWRGIATAAAEQCGRNRVPYIQPAISIAQWLASLPASSYPGAPPDAWGKRLLLSLDHAAQPLATCTPASGTLTFLSGPEGGLTADEENAAVAMGFVAATLGPRTLRAETAPLACLAWLSVGAR